MESLTIPRFILGGVGSGVGKSLIGIGLAHELRRRGTGVSCAVIGPSLLQAVIYRRISGRYVHCFDERLLTPRQHLAGAYMAGVGADIILIDGHGGLFDTGDVLGARGTDAQLAAFLGAPVVLVVDGRGLRQSVVALLKGFNEYASGFEIAGAVFNKFNRGREVLASERALLNDALKRHEMPELFGLLPLLDKEPSIPNTPLTQAENQTSLPLSLFSEVSGLVREFMDVDRIIELAAKAETVALEGFEHKPSGRRCKIGVTDDSAFSLSFQDNIDLLRLYGAEIISVSPLADEELPDGIGGLYITGAYLEEYASEIAVNDKLKKAIREFADCGGVVYSEGGGTAYLCEQFEIADGEKIDGVGLIPGVARRSSMSLAYIEAVTVDESVLGRAGLIIKGVTTGEWRVHKEPAVVKVLRVSKEGQKATEEGYSPGAQMLTTFGFLHMGSNPAVAKNIVDAAQVAQKG